MELIASLLVASIVATTPSITATELVSNVAEVKASRTLNVNALPGNGETIYVGTHLSTIPSRNIITFTSVAGSTSDELNATDGFVTIDRDTGAGNTPRTASDIASIMNTITNLFDVLEHGTLSISSSGTNIIFTTAGTESSATAIIFTDNTGGDISSTSSTTGAVPVAQQVKFVPENIYGSYKYTISINGVDYTTEQDSDSTVGSVGQALYNLLGADSSVSCSTSAGTEFIDCTANVTGIPFTYGTRVDYIGGSMRTRTSSSSDSSSAPTVTQPIDPLPSTLPGRPSITPSTPSSPVSLPRSLSRGKTGEDIRVLQRLLNRDPETQISLTGPGSPGNETSIFGPLTLNAVQKFQLKYSIANPGTVGYGVVGPKTRAKLKEIYGE